MLEILLATYNGEQFLKKQIDSLLQQTIQDFRILVRDDGSSDQTVVILREYIQQYPEKISLIEDSKKNLGASGNFGELLRHATADYLFFCDQDDVWLPDKMEITLKKIQELEQQYPGKPAMVYSDMTLIDENDEVLFESEWKQLQIDPRYFIFHRLLIQNIPHGCTMVINRPLKELALPIPQEAIMHDHWLAIVTSLFGVQRAITTPTILIRHHSRNVTRKILTTSQRINRYLKNFFSDESYEKMVRLRVNQAKAVKEYYASRLSPDQIQLLDQCILLGSTSGFRRKWIYVRNGFFRTNWRYSLKMILRG